MRLLVLIMIYLVMSLATSNILPLGQANHDPSSAGYTVGRFLAESLDRHTSCKSNQFVCRLRGSNGPDCCQNSCVNMTTDRWNCGRCGNKCKYMESCCGGQCVNLMRSKKHCGRCSNKCKKGASCSYGMCRYA